ncbi:MAG: hypothetical protein AB198_01125 [Parcubacteria bacterium C7867-003]|nr:MAG: hypothetical protein AB198_01125 [Parcubacteria bacterium C7867-003]
MKKLISIIFTSTALLLIGFYALNSYIYNEKQGNSVTQPENVLENTEWEWDYTQILPGKKVVTPERGKFILFLKDGKVTSTTDCNSMSGQYVKDGEVLSFTPFTSTKMYCAGSLESEYSRQIGLTNSYTIAGNELRLILNRDAGIMVFKKRSSSETQSVKLYFYNPSLDQGVGGVQCTRKGLVEVTRTIPKTQTPLQDSIKLLLRGELTTEEKTQGIATEFPLAGVSLVGANIKDGVATLEFLDPQNRTGGGSCRIAILWAQIEATAKQFSTIKEVRFIPEELFQP